MLRPFLLRRTRMSLNPPPESAPNSSDVPDASAYSLATTWRKLVELVNSHDSSSNELELESLEPRVLYDASPLLAVAGESLEQSVDLQLDEIADLCFEENLEHPACAGGTSEDFLVVDAQAFSDSATPLSVVSRQLVVIDERIEGFETLIADIT